MSESDRPLPTPPRSRFGRDSQEEAGPASGMVSDRMALAAAEGRLEEFLQHEIPEGDHARNLAMMMMGMSGMMPPPGVSGPLPGAPTGEPAVAAFVPAQPPLPDAPGGAAGAVPPEVLAAIEQGDVASLASLLRAEQERRTGEPFPGAGAAQPAPSPLATPGALPPAGAGPLAAPRAGIDAAIVDELIRIAAANDVTVDWLMLRAVKLYVEEYRKTGRL